MSAAAFAYAVILRAGAPKADLLSLLPESRRSEIESVLDSLKQVEPDEVRRKLDTLRSEQVELQRKAVERRTGLQLDHVSPRLSVWLSRPF
jgi:DNA primase large subunit